MVEVVYQVRSNETGENVAEFPAGDDSGEKSMLAEAGARDLARASNAADKASGGWGWTFTVVRGFLIRDHCVPALRNVVF